MKNLFDQADVADVRNRLVRLSPASTRQWGRMNPAQVLAHCSGVMEFAVGDSRPPRVMIGRVLGWAIKRLAVNSDAPLRPNSPTLPHLIVGDERDFEAERARLFALIDRFVAGGATSCTTHPHPFFGRMTPHEWAVFEYKHLDHHLRQFGE